MFLPIVYFIRYLTKKPPAGSSRWGRCREVMWHENAKSDYSNKLLRNKTSHAYFGTSVIIIYTIQYLTIQYLFCII
ncbi:protein of unknown function [Magnetospirillum sp. XM-1]|nr:protein of unknown function [Magnetospirillum sp. XM-1]